MVPNIEKLRVATDFSSFADNAVARGIQLAQQIAVSQVEICHVLERHRVRAVRDLLPAVAELQKHQHNRCEETLADSVAALSSDSGLDVLGVVLEGEVSQALVSDVDANTLLVVGHQGAESVRKIALGSVTERVVRTSEAPVLVVKLAPTGRYRQVLVAVDFSADSLASLQWACLLAPDAKLTVLHAYPPLPTENAQALLVSKADFDAYQSRIVSEAKAQIEALLSDCGLSEDRVDVVMEHGYPPELVEKEVQARGVDLVIAGKHGHSRFADWLLGSVTSHILVESSADVLVVSASA